jgi:hypothetical protein
MQLTLDPTKWHSCSDDELTTCQQNANCYSYALNRPDYYWAVPGLGFAQTNTQHFLEGATKVFEAFPNDDAFRHAMTEGAQKDGLLPIPEPEAREDYYVVALFINDKAGNRDFHWYRQDDDDTWSHKNGRAVPTNKDDSGNAISDPREAGHAAYPIFGGFFLVPRQGIELQPIFPLA